MAVALTSFVQPMLIGNQSSNSSIQISTGEEEDLMTKDACPSPTFSNDTANNSDTPLELDIKLEGKTSIINKENTCNTNSNNNNNSDSESSYSTSLSVSMSQCRYCYTDISRKSSVSQCHCSGVLCRECLINELKLTHGRANSSLQCTVCKNDYDVKTEFNFSLSKDCNSFCIDSLIHCGLKDEQYLLDSVGGKVGFFLVILGINTWILSTSLLFAFPPNGCPIELYYMVGVFDFAVGISTIWFIIKCRYLSPAFLSIMYLLRFIYILLGWIPQINFCNIYVYHALNKNHISILSYFLSFSFIASIIMSICWIIDLKQQYKKYKKQNGKLILKINTKNNPKNTNNIKIQIDDVVNHIPSEIPSQTV